MSIVETVKPRIDKAMYFTDNNYVQTGISGIPLTTELTIIVLAKINSATKFYYNRFVGMNNYYVEFSYGVGSKNQLGYYYRNNGHIWIGTGVPADLDTWQIYALIFDNGVTKVCKGEEIIFTRTEPGTSLSAYLDKVTLAWTYSLDPSYRFLGDYALVLIYNQALTLSEIKHILHNPSNPIQENLILWLDARNVSGSTWYDLSPYKNHGTIYGATQVSLPNPPVPAGV